MLCNNQTKSNQLFSSSSNEKNNYFKSVIQLFQTCAQAQPNSVALLTYNTVTSYSELDKKSTQIANYLLEKGLQPGDCVGCYLKKGHELIIFMLAILKAGAVYVPLDPKLPPKRIEHMVSEVAPVFIISDDTSSERLSNFSSHVLAAQETLEKAQYNDTQLKHSIQKHDLACILFTSGSTGKPKGILIEHGGLCYSIKTHFDHYKLKMRGLLSGSIGFDASLLTTFFCLSSEGSVYIPSCDEETDPLKIVSLINQHSIEYLLSVPSLYSMILSADTLLPTLKIVSLVGEPMPKTIPVKHKELAEAAILYNEYGPTEHGMGATIAKIYDPQNQIISKITIGKPYSGTTILILDQNLNQLKDSQKGEICISGPSIARGYLNNPELTEKKFIHIGQQKFYLSGDIGCFLPDGNLEIIGRKDEQLKIRGFRVEPAEVERALTESQLVNEAVVTVEIKKDEQKQLVAYYTPKQNHGAQDKVLAYLKDQLPSYMIPSRIVEVEKFNLNPIGKIDRNNLPKHEISRPQQNQTPKTELERILYLIWKTVLCLESFDLEDNFFDLGGTSFTLARIQTEILQELNLKVSITDLLDHPTISQLAKFLSQKVRPKNTDLYHDRASKRKTALSRLRKRAVNE